MGRCNSSNKTFATPAAMMLALQPILTTHVRLSHIVIFLLSRLLVHLPRHLTTFSDLSSEQRRHLLGKVLAVKSDQGVPAGKTVTIPLPLGRQTSSKLLNHSSRNIRVTKQQPCPVPFEPSSQQMNVTTPPPITCWSVTVNILGNGTVVNSDELMKAVGRQAQAQQTRNGSLLNEVCTDKPAGALENGVVINVHGAECVVGGAATVKEALRGKKRQREEAKETNGGSEEIKQGDMSDQRPSRRRRCK
ncbi:MAG: hypothetical protein Q9159_004081 [Coniocarpon cinnabarinum]